MAYNATVDTITLEEIMPDVVDTVLRTNLLTTRVLAKTKVFDAATINFPIKYRTGTPIQNFQGFDVLPFSYTDIRVSLKYNPKFSTANVALAVTDIAANNTAGKVIDLVKVESLSRAQDLADGIGTQFYADATGFGGNAFNGLGNLVSDTGTVGGLSRSTYPTLASTVTNSSGTLSLFKMRTLWNSIADADVMPTETLTDYGTWALYETLLQPTEIINKRQVDYAPNFKGWTGFDALMFAGLPVFADRKCPSGYMYMLNTDYLNFYGLPVFSGSMSDGQMDGKPIKVGGKLIKGNQYGDNQNLGFFWTGFIKATNMMAYNSFVVLGGNLITDNPRRQGLLYGITGV